MTAKCPYCRGPGVFLGKLGVLRHYRCRDCGITWSKGWSKANWRGKSIKKGR